MRVRSPPRSHNTDGMELTIEEYKMKNAWLSEQNKRMLMDMLEMNGFIEAYQAERGRVIEVLTYCGHDAMGTAYKECDARIMLLNMHKMEFMSALENDSMPAKEYAELMKLKTLAEDIMPFTAGQLERMFRLIEKYSTYKRPEEVRNPFGRAK